MAETEHATDPALDTADAGSADARKKIRRQAYLYIAVTPVLSGLTAVFAFWLAGEIFGTGGAEYWIGAPIILTCIYLPIMITMAVVALKQQIVVDKVIDQRAIELRLALARADDESEQRERQVERRDFEGRLINALEMAENEPEVLDVVTHSFAVTLPGRAAELLLADNSHAHLTAVATAEHDGANPGCAVQSPNQCPAARRAQLQRFTDSEALDACPKLRGRAGGACSAVCVPVSIMGRTVGVIHATGPVGWTVDDDTREDLSTLAKQAGSRLGLLRVMAETQLQAETDGLTGLWNRRTMENEIRKLRRGDVPFALAMVDLDHFKQLNDTYGHDTGDRALRLFAQTLRDEVREGDIVARYGGEEFVVVFPKATRADAATVLERVRAALHHAHQAAGLPEVTASFGVVDAEHAEALEDVLRRADTTLFEAKHTGRDRIVIDGPEKWLDAQLTELDADEALQPIEHSG